MPSYADMFGGQDAGMQENYALLSQQSQEAQQAEQERREQRKQALDIAGKRLQARDQFGYDAALSNQRYGQQVGLEDIHNVHEDELYDRHQAGQMAEMHLQHLQQQEQAKLLHQQDLQKLGIQQNFQVGRDQYQAGVQEQRDYRLNDFDTAKAEQLHGYDMEKQGQQLNYDAAKTGFVADQDQQQTLLKLQHDAALHHMAMQGQLAREEMIRRGRLDEISEKHKGHLEEVQQLERTKHIQAVTQGLEKGTLILDDQTAQDVAKQRSAIAGIRRAYRGGQISQEERDAQLSQATNDLTDMYLEGARPVAADEKAKTRESVRQALIKSRVSPEDQGLPWQLNKEGTDLELPRGMPKKAAPKDAKPVDPEKQKQAQLKTSRDRTAAVKSRLDQLLVKAGGEYEPPTPQHWYERNLTPKEVEQHKQAHLESLKPELQKQAEEEIDRELQSGSAQQPQPGQPAPGGAAQPTTPQGPLKFGQGFDPQAYARKLHGQPVQRSEPPVDQESRPSDSMEQNTSDQPGSQQNLPVVSSPEDLKRHGLKKGDRFIYNGREMVMQ